MKNETHTVFQSRNQTSEHKTHARVCKVTLRNLINVVSINRNYSTFDFEG
jgi:hypothetical protein